MCSAKSSEVRHHRRRRIGAAKAAVAPFAMLVPLAALAVAADCAAGQRAVSPVPGGPLAVTTTSAATTTTSEDPGLLPQTDALPSADTATFHAAMTALWEGVVTGSVSGALPAFFPERAYLQVKAVADPAADYRERLLGGFAADLMAAHELLGTGAPSATLVAVEVPAAYAHWVPPGVCFNRIGYYEVGQSRLVYQQGGTVRSFGIASLISWRGVWYVVHLGAVVRSGPGGVVDDPETGPGKSPPSSSC